MTAEEDRRVLKFISCSIDSKFLKRKLKSSEVNLKGDHPQKQFSHSSSSEDVLSSDDEDRSLPKKVKLNKPAQRIGRTVSDQTNPKIDDSDHPENNDDRQNTEELHTFDNEIEQDKRDFLANLMTKFYQSLTKNLSAINGKLADVIVRLEVIEETVAKLQKNIDSDLLDNANCIEDQNVDQTPINNRIRVPISTLDEFNEFEEKIADNSYRRKIIIRLLRMVDGSSA